MLGALPEPFIQKDDHFPMGVEVACAPSEEAVRLNTRRLDPNTEVFLGGQSV